LKSGRVSGAFDNPDGPLAEFGEGITQTGADIDTVAEEMAQLGKQLADGLDDKPGTIAILDFGRVHLGADQQSIGLCPLIFLAASPRIAALPRSRTGYPAARRSRSS
jgi:hypothetical protein